MQFLFYSALALHLFSVVIWIGGLLFIGGVMTPILHVEKRQLHELALAFLQRFTGFVWMSAATIIVTGFVLLAYHPEFRWFDFANDWAAILHAKILLFLLMLVPAWFSAKSVKEALSLTDEEFHEPSIDQRITRGELIFFRMKILNRASIVLGIGAIFLAAALTFY